VSNQKCAPAALERVLQEWWKNIQLVIERQGARVPILWAGLLIFFRGDEAKNYGAESRWQR
jgi:hypothetical protein